MITLEAINAPILIGMHDPVEMRIIVVVQILDGLMISRRLVGADGNWPV